MAEKSKTEKRSFNVGTMSCKEEIFENTSEIRKSTLNVNNCDFDITIEYIESRNRYICRYIYNGKTISLSFFENKKIAYKSVVMTIAGLFGVRINNIPTEVLRGV